jgi:hypothetical protein
MVPSAVRQLRTGAAPLPSAGVVGGLGVGHGLCFYLRHKYRMVCLVGGGVPDLKEQVAAGQGVVVMPNSIDVCLIYHVPRVCVVCTQAMMLRS